MIQEAQVVLHGGSGQVLLLEYLFGVLVHLLAFAAIAFGARRWIGSPETTDAEFATGRDTEEGGRRHGPANRPRQ